MKTYNGNLKEHMQPRSISMFLNQNNQMNNKSQALLVGQQTNQQVEVSPRLNNLIFNKEAQENIIV